MTRRRLILAIALIVTLVALTLAFAWQLLPSTLFADPKFISVASFVTALVASGITGYAGFAFSRFLERPILRIEFVDIRSERTPFSLSQDIWWYATHGSLLNELSDEPTKIALNRNELEYYNLRVISDAADISLMLLPRLGHRGISRNSTTIARIHRRNYYKMSFPLRTLQTLRRNIEMPQREASSEI